MRGPSFMYLELEGAGVHDNRSEVSHSVQYLTDCPSLNHTPRTCSQGRKLCSFSTQVAHTWNLLTIYALEKIPSRSFREPLLAFLKPQSTYLYCISTLYSTGTLDRSKDRDKSTLSHRRTTSATRYTTTYPC